MKPEFRTARSRGTRARSFNLHVRLTHRCNADCSYCSCAPGNEAILDANQYRRALSFIAETWRRLEIFPEQVSLQYMGGEVLILSPDTIERMVTDARRFFGDLGVRVIDGVQTNLIGSERRVDHLYKLFGSRVGTSVDHFSQQRTVGGSSERYRTIWIKEKGRLKTKGVRVPAILVVDGRTVSHVTDEVAIAAREGYNLTLRPIYEAARPVAQVELAAIHSAYRAAFDMWFLQQRILLEPFYDMVRRRVMERTGTDDPLYSAPGCHFQSDCAVRTMHLEPDGTLYLCQDISDLGVGRLGNALVGEFDDATWRSLLRRQAFIARQCVSCSYYRSCQGGCMAEALSGGRGMYDRTVYCGIWKDIFHCIDEAIDELGPDVVRDWAMSLETEERKCDSTPTFVPLAS